MLQPTLSGPTGVEQVADVESQVRATWQAASGVQVVGRPLALGPAWQVSLSVQALPSVHDVPLAFGEQTPASPDRLHEVHWSVHDVLQQTPPTQKPLLHWLVDVQALPWVTS